MENSGLGFSTISILGENKTKQNKTDNSLVYVNIFPAKRECVLLLCRDKPIIHKAGNIEVLVKVPS